MKKKFFSIFIGAFIISLGWSILLIQQADQLKTSLIELTHQAKAAKLDPEKWNHIKQNAQTIPNIYPLSSVRSIFLSAANITEKIKNIEQNLKKIQGDSIDIKTINDSFQNIKNIQTSLQKIQKSLKRIPDFSLTSEQKNEKEFFQKKIRVALSYLQDIKKLQLIINNMHEKKERILILLQNQNEPRSTGGFVGSLFLIDPDESGFTWKFNDIYALDRLVKPEAKLPAPEFFHPLSQNISLRDANLFPDFKTSGDMYRHFFRNINERPPTTIIGINLDLIKEILKITGPVDLPQWEVTVNEYNVDLVLQFLVESKVEGRFGTKKPVFTLAQILFSPETLQKTSLEKISTFDIKDFISRKNLLAYSRHSDLQKLFQKWNITGEIKPNPEADNFAYFDFVSVGANKSEKFMWTKLHHNSEINEHGIVKNTLTITRTHALRPGELFELLGSNTWSQNLKDLLTNELLWKLGSGQNRTIIRAYLPKDATVLHFENPSGKVTQSWSQNKQFKVLTIPAFVNTGESIDIKIHYQIKINRGSKDWRPYFFQTIGTPGRNQTTILSTISTPANGRFTAESDTIGRPLPLIDQEFRALIEFDRP